MKSVAICTVTFNDQGELDGYFDALRAIEPGDLEVRAVLVDCASDDASVAALRDGAASLPFRSEVVALASNRGFAGGMNAALDCLDRSLPEVDGVLALNPDARLTPDALLRLVLAFRELARSGYKLGAVTARLLRPSSQPRLLDACGMRLSLAWRHFDRGSDECDRGQYAQRVEVFGGTGAGTLFALAALRDVAVAGNVFDPDFHSFREDAELAFRLQERGWSAVYEPSAIIEHRRYNLPQRRRKVSAAVNTHSLKNRYLLRILHQSFLNWLWTGIPATVRDLGILIYVLLRERSSLVAYVWLWQNRRALWLRRRVLRARRTVPQWRVERWFFRQDRPVTENR